MRVITYPGLLEYLGRIFLKTKIVATTIAGNTEPVGSNPPYTHCRSTECSLSKAFSEFLKVREIRRSELSLFSYLSGENHAIAEVYAHCQKLEN
jgi:hypothetical protein